MKLNPQFYDIVINSKDQRLNKHILPTRINTMMKLRIIVTANIGDPSAAIFGVRCKEQST